MPAAPAPFAEFAVPWSPRSPLRDAITAATRRPEPECVEALLPLATCTPDEADRIATLAARLVQGLRARGSSGGREGLVQGLLQEFSLSSQEGVALMCLAEALLRIPDVATRDALIRDKIGRGDWQAHLGRSPSSFVNAASWGLLLTGRLVATHTEQGLGAALTRLIARGGEPLIRRGVDAAMRVMGEQFVTGETIGQALDNARPHEAAGFRYSYDMLGEAALTDADARRYLEAYEQAIDAIGITARGRGVIDGAGISIKLSALHPRYSRAQAGRVHAELYPRLRALAVRARGYDIGLNIDAEEADRLELSLDLLERLAFEPELAGWHGLGFVVQAYQKRCPFVIDWVVDLARRSGHRLMVRLVKGAYWDSEIKRAQVDGLPDYPVYTRKPHTDVAYLACARKLLAAADAIYPQFATHNAQTLASIVVLAGDHWQPGQYEFQCLHGMGEPLYEQVTGAAAAAALRRPCRIYAPVGSHETLLAYLVRRLLENGANTSFVNRVADPAVPVATLVADPVAAVRAQGIAEGRVGLPHPKIALPPQLYGRTRRNSVGLDLADELQLVALEQALAASRAVQWTAVPTVAGAAPALHAARPVANPADHGDVVGQVVEATLADVDGALAAAAAIAPAWAATPVDARAQMLERAADAMQAALPQLVGLIVREAGKTAANAVGEVREAIDFLRYYAGQARGLEAGTAALGPVVCISPWNFPLAIFTGQVAAALAAGNPVLAKPAEQTPLTAARAVAALHAAGVPQAALQLLPGRGEIVGAALVADARIAAVVFTGSTEVARVLAHTLAGRLDAGGRPLPLIAETGGQNAMIVDSSALPEQVVADVLASAFDSAGQRCSALRVLCLQDDVADRIEEMLAGALRELSVAPPDRLATDVGPVIDADARHAIEQHLEAMRARGRPVQQVRCDEGVLSRGTFVAPALVGIGAIAELKREVFGPVLHVLRYPRAGLATLLQEITATGYALTLGLHTRVDETIAAVTALAPAGNLYVNRNMIGAVVGVQPFGGDGLSGTGPKAGGPLYLRRLRTPAATPDALDALARRAEARPLLQQLHDWVCARGVAHAALAPACLALMAAEPVTDEVTLRGPTGERNTWRLVPRRAVLCVAQDELQRLLQLAHTLAAGTLALWWAADQGAHATWRALPPALQQRVTVVGTLEERTFELALVQGTPQEVAHVAGLIADRPGPIVPIHTPNAGAPGAGAYPLALLMAERTVSVNTAAAGGNASLMTIG